MTNDEHDILREVFNNQKWMMGVVTDLKKENSDAHAVLQADFAQMSSAITSVTTTVYGQSSDNGLCGDFKDLRKLNRRNFLIIVSILILLAAYGVLDWNGMLSLVG